jgi:hypothetical protein
MLHICVQCGAYHADQIIDPAGPYAICPECGNRRAFKWHPLLIVGGASGAGKSTVCQALMGTLESAVPLDSDILWNPVYNTPETGFQTYFETWLRLCVNIGQAGKPVVLFGAGVGVPQNLETCIARRYFPSIHYLALTCDAAVLRERLLRRPDWRHSGTEAYLREHTQFNQWFKTNAEQTKPPIDLIDTTSISPQETLPQVIRWIETHVPSDQGTSC